MGHYLKDDLPAFHYDLYETLETLPAGLLEVVAFRGSGKSTISALALPLWAAYTGKRKFIILCSDTFNQAKLLVGHIQEEIENNPLLKEDYGAQQSKKEWQAMSMVLNNDVRIVGASRGQKIRGSRHKEMRPDLIICDDVENIDDVRTREMRDKTDEWFTSDVMPALEQEGTVLLIGSLLHHDSLIARMRNKIQQFNIGVVHEYPLFNSKNENVWAEKFTPAYIERIKATMGSRYFLREYCLALVPTDEQIVKTINHYTTLPNIVRLAIGVDLAISQSDTADYTAICGVALCEDGKFYVLGIKYGRWLFNETLAQTYAYYMALRAQFPEHSPQLGIEDVAYQRAAIEEVQRRYQLPVNPIRHGGQDKRARLEVLSPYFEQGQVLFPAKGCENLTDQLIGFGIEPHDDLVDAFEMAMRQCVNTDTAQILAL